MIMVNPKMMCSYRYSCLDFPVALFNCHMKRCESFLYHVCQGGNVDMHDINDDVAEWNIFTVVLTSFGWEEILIN